MVLAEGGDDAGLLVCWFAGLLVCWSSWAGQAGRWVVVMRGYWILMGDWCRAGRGHDGSKLKKSTGM